MIIQQTLKGYTMEETINKCDTELIRQGPRKALHSIHRLGASHDLSDVEQEMLEETTSAKIFVGFMSRPDKCDLHSSTTS